MLLGEVLVANGWVTLAQVQAALERQRRQGGSLGDSLVAIGAISGEKLRDALTHVPAEPRDVAATGVPPRLLLELLLKIMYLKEIETPAQLGEALKLPAVVVDELLRMARDAGLVTVLGSAGGSLLGQLRHDLTQRGQERARAALERSQYAGPAPVPLAAYIEQVERQHLTNERVTRDDLAPCFAHLVLPERLLDELGPAANSARAVLLYGPPGSGKTSIAESLGRGFKGMVYVPRAIEVDGQVISVFDPAQHQSVGGAAQIAGEGGQPALMRESLDERWVLCRRPLVVAGGELRMDMVELRYNAGDGLYEAPLQLKAMNGIFMIDDFGRQRIDPRDLLNRWILPLEKRFDFLHLPTGLKFRVPFDVLIVFSTNLAPEALMDEAFLRRIPYKIRVGAPTADEYAEIFRRGCASRDVQCAPDALEALRELYARSGEPLASYHPGFLVDRVRDRARYRAAKPFVDRDALAAVWPNLFVQKAEKSPQTQ
ncbi:MAG: ATPase [Bacillota bacterium]